MHARLADVNHRPRTLVAAYGQAPDFWQTLAARTPLIRLRSSRLLPILLDMIHVAASFGQYASDGTRQCAGDSVTVPLRGRA